MAGEPNVSTQGEDEIFSPPVAAPMESFHKQETMIFGRPIREVVDMLDVNHKGFLVKLSQVQQNITDLAPGDAMVIRGKLVPYLTKNQMLQTLRQLLYDADLVMLPAQQIDIREIAGGKISVTNRFTIADIRTGYSFSRDYTEMAEMDGGIGLATGKAYRQFLQMTFNFTIGATEVADTEMIPTAEEMANGHLDDLVQALRLKASTALNKVGTEKALRRVKDKGQYVTTTDPEQMTAQECLTVISATMDLLGIDEGTKGKLRKIVPEGAKKAGSEGTGGEVTDGATT